MSLTNSGYIRPRLNEIKAEYDQKFTDAFGSINTNADSVIGEIIAIFSAALDEIYELAEDTYNSMYPFSAEGTSLDGAVALVGLTRLGATPTRSIAACYGAESTLIPAGSFVRSQDGRIYTSLSDSIISRARALDVLVKPLVIANNTAYQIILNGVGYTYTSDASATAQEIVSGLKALINPVLYVATDANAILGITSINKTDEYTLTVGSNLEIDKLSSPVLFEAIDLGAYVLPVGALSIIDTPVVGWDSIKNLAPGVTGRFVETDEELRIRHANNIQVTGAATVKAIRARILAEVDSVSYVAVYENRSDTTDIFGLPPHSFETVVIGGLDFDIASKIFEVKPAGIETYGNTSVTVKDENGDGQIMRFSRSQTRYAWVRVTVTQLYPEEALSTQIVTAITNAVIAYGNDLNIGEDIITQRIFGYIFDATTGLGAMTIEAALTNAPGDTPSYSTANIPIGRATIADFSATRIVVIGVS